MTERANEHFGGSGRMRTAAWLAWSVAAVCVVVMVLTLLFQLLTPSGSQGAYSLVLYALFAVF
jgi:hypothetical protein